VCFMPASDATKGSDRNAITAVPSLARISTTHSACSVFSLLIRSCTEHSSDRPALGIGPVCSKLYYNTEPKYTNVTIIFRRQGLLQKGEFPLSTPRKNTWAEEVYRHSFSTLTLDRSM
jgi:hypothetical protein